MIKKILVTTMLVSGLMFAVSSANSYGSVYADPDTSQALQDQSSASSTPTSVASGSGGSNSLKAQACEGATGGTLDSSGKCVDPNGTTLEGEDGLIKKIINTLLFVIGAASVIIMIYGGLRYVLSAGDTGKVTEAKNTIIYAAIGLVVAFLAYAIVTFVINAIV